MSLDPKRCEELNRCSTTTVLVINGDGRDIHLLTEEGIKEPTGFRGS